MLATTVESTTLAAVAYNASAQVLWLEFKTGALYRYWGVPSAIYRGLLTADSKGRYFNTHIRSCFPYLKEQPPKLHRSFTVV